MDMITMYLLPDIEATLYSVGWSLAQNGLQQQALHRLVSCHCARKHSLIWVELGNTAPTAAVTVLASGMGIVTQVYFSYNVILSLLYNNVFYGKMTAQLQGEVRASQT